MAAVHTFGELTAYLGVLSLLAPLLGAYIYRVMEGNGASRTRSPGALERLLYRAARVDPLEEMSWGTYGGCLLVFTTLGTLFLYGVQRLQGWLPLNPRGLEGVAPDTAFNTAVSFASNTSWQSYAGETTLGHLAQMLGIGAESFLSGATGIAVLIVLLRGFSRASKDTLGNPWVDLTRATLYVLLPLALVFALVLVGEGAIQNFDSNRAITPLQTPANLQPRPGVQDHEGSRAILGSVTTGTQVIPTGPVASQTAIALLSGDGGGFFNVNSAHPFANPTALSNFIEMLAILLIPAALCHTFGLAVGDRRQGWTLFLAMASVFALLSVVAIRAEQAGNPGLARLGVDQLADSAHSGGNMEGKETRFGAASSALFAVVTTSGGDGAVDSMHDSFTPMGGLVPMVLMQSGEVIFGGPGSGLYGMLVYALAAVFIASLMVGRAPEYLGKHIAAFEVKMVATVILLTPLLVLAGTATSVLCTAGRTAVGNPGAHGFSEILYAFSSASNNNGSAFMGLAAGSVYYNVLMGFAMWLGRFVPLMAVLAIAGSLAAKRRRSPGPGTLPTHGPLFVGLLIAVVVLVGVLSYGPALALGPIIEHLQLFTRATRL